MVVFRFLCPMSCWMVLMSVPAWSRWVAKVWRKVCAVTRLVMSHWSTAFLMALDNVDLDIYHRRTIWGLERSLATVADGNTYCHWNPVSAFGYLRAKACGRFTNPQPRQLSLTWSCLRQIRCLVSGWTSRSGRSVTRELLPLVFRIVMVRLERSISCTRRVTHSLIRIPVPYSRLAASAVFPDIESRIDLTSSTLNTVGIYSKRLGRIISPRSPISVCRICLYRKAIALSAWDCVLPDTLRLIARSVKNRRISEAVKVAGCWSLWK